MSSQPSTTFTRPRAGTIVRAAAFVVVIALLVVGAVMAQGFDVKQAVIKDGTIWVLNKTGDTNTGQYARVDTGLLELQTVKDAAIPTTIVQHESSAVLITKQNSSLARIDPGRPIAYPDDSTDLASTPEDTTEVVTAGDYIAYRTGTGALFVSTVDDVSGTPTEVRPHAGEPVADGEDEKSYSSDAIAIGPDGILYSYSAAEGAVFRYDIAVGQKLSDQPVTGGPDKANVAGLTVVGTSWVLFDATTFSYWTNGQAARPTGLTAGATLAIQQPSVAGDYVYYASSTALGRAPLGGGSANANYFTPTAGGVPARPTSVGTESFAAWVPDKYATDGTMWRSSSPTDQLTLTVGTPAATDAPEPVFRTNGSTIVLNDATSGLVWKDDATLVPSSTKWALDDDSNTTSAEAEQEAEPKENVAPVADDDTFGVRAGQLISLPVLLNDSDANSGDVLTIVPSSISGLDASFGVVSSTNNDQQLSIDVAAGATGSATFSYTITDGEAPSAPATVTVTVVPPDENNAPVKATISTGNGNSKQADKTLEVLPGGSGRVNILGEWYDPDGDPIYLKSATLDDPASGGVVAALPDGWLVFQDTNPDGAGGPHKVTIEVADVFNASEPAPFIVTVSTNPTLAVSSFAMTTRVDEGITVDPTSFVSGAAGQFTLESVVAPKAEGTSAVVNSDKSTFLFSSTVEGSYTVEFSVTDGVSPPASAQARITVLAADALAVTTAPITAFIRPRLDSTIDVFSAISNPARRVLLLTSAIVDKQDGTNTLTADVVDHHYLRVKGSLAGNSSSSSGVVGVVTYTIADGEGDAAAKVTGRATVVMLEAPSQAPPIAIDDSVIVRAGTQVDVPVLANDVAPNGNTVVLSSAALDYPADQGLAFVSGSKVRILAPAAAGTYTIRYAVYSAGFPDSTDTADIHVTVRSADGNGLPQPKTLEGRVFAGETVSIPFSGTGIDPDGDDVFLDRIEQQPQASAGIASLSSSGQAIQYTAPQNFTGVAEFTYRVTDGIDFATATVRIGVLSSASDLAPVTFSDYVEVTAGADSSVVVRPTDNDIDPRGGTPALDSVVPDAAQKLDDGSANPEYDALNADIEIVGDGSVRLKAGTEVGTKTFVYGAVSAAGGSPKFGYIVLKIVGAAVPDLPFVTDSYLSIDDRADFSTAGLDVVSGHVSWLSGDVSTLTLKLWGEPNGFTVNGNRISGPLGDATVLVPFQLDGLRAGQPVSAFGFLTVPGKNDIILALRPDRENVVVAEDKAQTFDMTKQVSVPPTDKLEVTAAVAAGQRPAATCSVAGTVVTYTAKHGDPYEDACVVSVRLASQTAGRVTQLVVPVQVTPTNAIPVLTSDSLSPRPSDAPIIFDVDSILDWKGNPTDAERNSVTFTVSSPQSSDFIVTSTDAGHTISVGVTDGAIPGRTDAVTIAFGSPYASQPSTTLSLVVGPAPPDIPKGGSFSVDCDADAPEFCGAAVIGGHGETSIYTRSKLVLESVQASAAGCPGVTFKREDDEGIAIDYSPDVAGGTCQVNFVVKDVQGNVSSGPRNGTLTLHLNGFPKAPERIKQTGYGDGTVELTIDPPKGGDSFPVLDHFEVDYNGKTITCALSGKCPTIKGLTNGASTTFVASSWSEFGQSLTTAQTTAYSYAKPDVGNVTATAVFDRSLTSLTKGAVDVTITGSESSVEFFEITGASGKVRRTGASTTVRVALPVGDQEITVTPISKFEVPPGDGSGGAVSKNKTVTVVGTPSFSADPTSITTAETSFTINGAKVNANKSPSAPELLYVVYAAGTPTCTVSDTGGGVGVSGVTPAGTSASNVVGNLTPNTDYSAIVCASNGFGVAQSKSVTDATFKEPAAPIGFTFDVSDSPDGSGVFGFVGTIKSDTEPTPPDPKFEVNFSGKDAMGSVFGADPHVKVRYCQIGHSDRCGAYSDVTPKNANRSYQMKAVVDDSAVSCVEGSAFVRPTVSRTNSLGTEVVGPDPVYYASDDTVLAAGPGDTVPVGAVKVVLGLSMNWPTEISGLVFNKPALTYVCTVP